MTLGIITHILKYIPSQFERDMDCPKIARKEF